MRIRAITSPPFSVVCTLPNGPVAQARIGEAVHFRNAGRGIGTPDDHKPRDPTEIGLGSVVLAHEGPDEGWWEAEVIGLNGRVFSLRWRDYPTQPTILRKSTELALLPPGEA
jgi:hypothetical protein